MKVVINEPKNGKSYQIELDETKSKPLMGLKIGNDLEGTLLGLTGYTLELTGGTDKDGFPMRKDLHGTDRKKILLPKGVGLRKTRKGERRKKTIRGNTISEEIAQVNTKVKKEGKESITNLLGITPKEQPAENKEGQ